MVDSMNEDQESPIDKLWLEYSHVFRDFDDLTLARWLAQTLSLIREEEEGLVFNDWAAEYTTKIIEALCGFRQIVEVYKPVPGI